MDSLVHCFTGSLIHWFIDSLIHSFIGPLVHWFVDSLIHCFVASLVHWFCDSVLMHSLIHWFIDSLPLWFIQSVVRGFLLSCHFIGISTSMCSFVDAPHNFNASLLLHLKNCPSGHSCLIVGLKCFAPSAPAWAGHYLVYIYIYLQVFFWYIYMYIIIYTYMLRVPVGEFPRVFDSFNSELSPPASCDSHVGSLVSCLIPVTVNPIMLQTGEMHQNLGQNWMWTLSSIFAWHDFHF